MAINRTTEFPMILSVSAKPGRMFLLIKYPIGVITAPTVMHEMINPSNES